MEIKDFSFIRTGSGFPACLDVRSISSHESYGVYAEVYTYRCKDAENFVQLRKHNKDNVVALFSFKWKEQENNLPEYWKDSDVMFDSREDK